MVQEGPGQISATVVSKTVTTPFLPQQIIDRIARRHKQDRRIKWKTLLCSLFFHFVLLIILSFTIPQLYRVKMDLFNVSETMRIFNLLPPVDPATLDTPFERKYIHTITNRNLLMPQPNNNMLSLKQRVITPVDKWRKQIGLAEDPRQAQLEKRVEYQPGLAYADSSPVIYKRILYENKSTSISGREEAEVFITVNLPLGNKTNYRQFILSGSIKPNVEKAYLLVNDDAQSLRLYSENFVTVVNLKKGLNKFTVLALTHEGGMGVKSFQLLFAPSIKGPIITLLSPENGQQGINGGQVVWVEGMINDRSIAKATLFVNKVPIHVAVTNGIFKREVLAPADKINTFQVMAVGRDGIEGYSTQHTVLAGYGIELSGLGRKNPRPY